MIMIMDMDMDMELKVLLESSCIGNSLFYEDFDSSCVLWEKFTECLHLDQVEMDVNYVPY